MPEMLPVPLPALRQPANGTELLPLPDEPAPRRRRRNPDLLHDHPGLVLGVLGAVVLLCLVLLIWKLLSR